MDPLYVELAYSRFMDELLPSAGDGIKALNTLPDAQINRTGGFSGLDPKFSREPQMYPIIVRTTVVPPTSTLFTSNDITQSSRRRSACRGVI